MGHLTYNSCVTGRGVAEAGNAVPALAKEWHYKKYTDGTHRSRLPEETLERIQRFFSDFGISRVANVTGLDVIGIPVVMVVRPNSRSLSVSQGKGATLAAAKVSGIMESIEAFHAETLDIPTRFLSHDDLLLHHDCPEISRLSLSLEKPFQADEKIPWVMGRDIASQNESWVPYEIVHSDYTHPLPFNSGFFISDSNGLASGNCLVEAVNHGLCEVIERDALTLWSLKDKEDREKTRVILSTIDDENCLSLIRMFEKSGIDIAVWDITSDVGIPAYACKIIQRGNTGTGIRPAMGAGCHLNKGVALSRALTEAAQSRLTFISGARDDQVRKIYNKYQAEEKQTQWRRDITESPEYVRFDARESYHSDYLEQDQDEILARLARAGAEQAICVDLTRPEYNIPVVKVIVPGMECHTAPEKRIPGLRAKNLIRERNTRRERHG